jgi:WD40 repeat protein
MHPLRFVFSSCLLLALGAATAAGQENRFMGRITFKDLKTSTIAMDADSKYVVFGFSNGSLAIVEPKPRKVVQIGFFAAHNGRTTIAEFSHDKKWVASGGSDGTVKLWDTAAIARWQDEFENRKEGAPRPPDPFPKKMFTAQPGGVNGLAFSPDAKRLATCGPDGSVKVWNVDTAKLVFSLAAHKGPALAVAYSPDGTQIASGGADKIARLWKAAASSKAVHVLAGHDGPVNSVAFSSDGKQLATASGAPKKGGQVRVFDVATGKEDYNLGPQDEIVTTVCFHPKLPRLAVGGRDKKIRVFDTEAKKPLYSDEHVADLIRVQFAGDGGRLGSVCPEEAKYWLGSPKGE